MEKVVYVGIHPCDNAYRDDANFARIARERLQDRSIEQVLLLPYGTVARSKKEFGLRGALGRPHLQNYTYAGYTSFLQYEP